VQPKKKDEPTSRGSRGGEKEGVDLAEPKETQRKKTRSGFLEGDIFQPWNKKGLWFSTQKALVVKGRSPTKRLSAEDRLKVLVRNEKDRKTQCRKKRQRKKSLLLEGRGKETNQATREPTEKGFWGKSPNSAFREKKND